jgi:membrane dipeptidase
MQASQLLHQAFVCDGHADTFRNLVFQEGSFTAPHGPNHLSLAKMRASGLNLQIAAVYTSAAEVGPASTVMALRVIEKIQATCQASLGALRLISSRPQLGELVQSGGQGILISLEGADPLLQEPALIDVFYRLGVRAIGLTHNHNSPAAGGCANQPSLGLTDFGKLLLERMAQLGMLLDTAHLSRRAFDEVLDVYSGPLMNSHSCCQKFVPGERNLADDQLLALARRGGLAAVTFVPKFLVSSGSATSHHVFAHLQHMVEIAGIDAVAIGSDFDGVDQLPTDLQGPQHLSNLVERMQEAGWKETDILKVLGGNWLRVLASVLPISS